MADIYEDIQHQGEKGIVVRIILDHREKLNIINTELVERLRTGIEKFHREKDLRLMILSGAGGRAFIGGVDINEMAGFDSRTAREFIFRLHRLCAAVRALPVPVIAKISGYCLGGGLEVAAACDLRIASTDAIFGMPEVKVGIPSVIEAALLPRLVGWGKARELIYTGRFITAEEALSCGLVEQVVSGKYLEDALNHWVAHIIEAGPRAVRLQKSLIKTWEDVPTDRAIEEGIVAFGKAYETDEPRRLMDRFLQRRK